MNTSPRRWLIVIPARLDSQRLPRKPLQDLKGLPLIVRVFKNLQHLENKATILVATDHQDVGKICTDHQVPWTMTQTNHTSGTDRCIEVAQTQDADFVLNVQGDEPFIAGEDLENLMTAMEQNPSIDIGTLVYRIEGDAALRAALDPNLVKAVRGRDGRAIYFSRAPLPYCREKTPPTPSALWQHIGVYAFKRTSLLSFADLPPSPLEDCEKLEQLRALEAGWHIYLQVASKLTVGIDTPHDLEVARAHYG